MEVYVHPCNKKNIGDDLNHWFWREALGDVVETNQDGLLVGIGTVLNDRLPKDRKIHVMGSGAGYGDIGNCADWNIHFVRGHLTAQSLGLAYHHAISDPAILISQLRPQSEYKKHKISFMPHVNIDSEKYSELIAQIGWHYISPSDDEASVLADIAASERLITSAMHGAILADSYRTPWLPISTSPEILSFKWQDWASSLSLDITLPEVPPLWPEEAPGFGNTLKGLVKRNLVEAKLKKLERQGTFILSASNILNSKQQQLFNKLGQIEQDLKQEVVTL
ncbi:polysaccharide pyruvyl transferase family protein [Vibrio alfacsensis]|uniref:polysaccharide pyruvyl transferase family protein n=1 Tax=Vibrio alfacsensis TaxID=1074311 RepID=UPI0040687F22